MNLHDAADKGNLDRVKTLVEEGFNKDNYDSEGWTPLWLASFNNHLEVVQYLVEQGASLDKDSYATHSTPLCTATHHGHLAIVRYLLEKGADKDKASIGGHNRQYRRQDTPLSYAVRRNHLEVAKLIMSYGAELDDCYLRDGRPIDLAISEEMRQAIRDEPSRRQSPGGCAYMNLYDSARHGDLERVGFLHEQGAEHDKVDSDGWTPLWWASSKGYFDVVRYLAEHGASLETVNNSTRSTPLINAVRNGHLETVRFLLEQGADRDKGDMMDYTPLHWAAIRDQLEIAMLLMSYGADLNAMNGVDQLPIDCADTEEMRQAILDEPRRRMDHGHKRATEKDRHPDAAIQQEDEEEEVEEGGEPSNKRPRLDEGAVAAVVEAEETNKVASEDEESEPSSDEGEEED